MQHMLCNLHGNHRPKPMVNSSSINRPNPLHTPRENQSPTKKANKRQRKEHRTPKTVRKQQDGVSKPLLISNYFNSPIKRHRVAKKDLKTSCNWSFLIQSPNICRMFTVVAWERKVLHTLRGAGREGEQAPLTSAREGWTDFPEWARQGGWCLVKRRISQKVMIRSYPENHGKAKSNTLGKQWHR